MSLLHRRRRKHARRHKKPGRKAPKVASKCLRACPRHIRLKCKPVFQAGTSTLVGKVCNLTVPGVYKAKGISSAAAGQKIASIKKMLRSKNCGDPKVHSN